MIAGIILCVMIFCCLVYAIIYVGAAAEKEAEREIKAMDEHNNNN
jgi:hypothetical protein